MTTIIKGVNTLICFGGVLLILAACDNKSSKPESFKINSTIPAANAQLVPPTRSISVTFNKPINTEKFSEKDFSLACSDTQVIIDVISFSDNKRTLTATPESALPENTTCTIEIAASIENMQQQVLGSPVSWSFGTTAKPETLALGKQIFRYDTFGDEQFWTNTLAMHTVIETAVDPITALSVGLKVDAEALPEELSNAIALGQVDLTSPKTTLALLKLDAVVGVKGEVETIDGAEKLTRVGVTCALCHSTVDNSFAEGIGKRLDGWPNRDLNPGAIIALSPALSEADKAIYNSWGPGMYDARFNQDGINSPHVITPAFGLNGINKITSTGDGDDIAYWNRYVAVTQMGGEGSFYEPRTGVNVSNGVQDLITDKLAPLQAYQLSLLAPPAPESSFNPEAAARGKLLFNNQAKCSSCHSGPEFTDANSQLHSPSEVVSEPEPGDAPGYASRSATKMYRTAPLKGIWQHPPYFHNGIAESLTEVVSLYNERYALALSNEQQFDLVEYLKSL